MTAKIDKVRSIVPALYFGAILCTAGLMHGDKFLDGSLTKAIIHSCFAALFLIIFGGLRGKLRTVFALFLIFVYTDIVVRFAFDSPASISVWLSWFAASGAEVFGVINSEFTLIATVTILWAFLVFQPADFPNIAALRIGQKTLKFAAVASIGLYIFVPTFLSLSDLLGSVKYQEGFLIEARAKGWSATGAKTGFALKDMSYRLPVIDSLMGFADGLWFLARSDIRETSGWTGVKPSKVGTGPFVIVIGESVRADHLSAYGYNRDTTPFLDRAMTAGIAHAYGPAVSAGTNTWNALPVMLSKAPSRAASQDGVDLGFSIIQLMKKADFEVVWLSNQKALDVWGLNLSHFVAQSDHYDYTPLAGEGYDEALIPRLEHWLKSGEDRGVKQVIFLHLYGSHFPFEKRVPKDFTSAFMDMNAPTRKDAYDQSIAYTDSLLQEIWNRLSLRGGSMIYVGDHGLSPYQPDDQSGLVHDVRSQPDPSALEVPLVVWGKAPVGWQQQQVFSLYYFECLVADWTQVSADQLTQLDYCADKARLQAAPFYNGQLQLKTLPRRYR